MPNKHRPHIRPRIKAPKIIEGLEADARTMQCTPGEVIERILAEHYAQDPFTRLLEDATRALPQGPERERFALLAALYRRTRYTGDWLELDAILDSVRAKIPPDDPEVPA